MVTRISTITPGAKEQSPASTYPSRLYLKGLVFKNVFESKANKGCVLEGNTDDDESGMSIKRDMKGSRIDSGVAYIREDFKQAVQLHIFYPSFLKKFPFF